MVGCHHLVHNARETKRQGLSAVDGQLFVDRPGIADRNLFGSKSDRA